MRPIRLRLKNFRSFRDEQTIEFSGLSLFAVIGETGAGKSSILQAISYALYGRPTFDNDTKQLIYSAEQTLAVELEFESQGERYRIVRSTSRTAYPLPAHKLEFLSSPTLPVSNFTDVNAKIVEILGLTHESFTRSVLLPQNEFDKLLLEKPSEKLRILKQVLGLSRLDRMRERLASPRDEAKAKVVEQEAILKLIPEDIVDRIAADEGRAERADRLAASLSASRELIAGNISTIAGLEGASAVATTKIAALSCAPALRGRHFNLSETATVSASFIANARAQLEALATQRAELDAKNAVAKQDGLDVATLVDIASQLTALRRERSGIATEEIEIAREQHDLATSHASIEEQETRLEPLKAELDEAREAATRETSRAKLDEERITQHGGTVKAHGDAQAAFAEASTALAADKLRLARSREAAAAAAKVAADAAREEATATDEKARADRAAGIAAYIVHLHPGDACPVCATILPEAFAPPVAPDISASTKRSASARSAATQAEATRARTIAEAESGERGVKIAEEKVAATRAAVDVAEGRMRELGIACPEDGSHEIVLAQLRTQIRDIRDRLKPFQSSIEEKVKAYESAREGLKRDRRAATERDARHERRVAALRQRRLEFEKDRKRIPLRFQPSPQLEEADLNSRDERVACLRAEASNREAAMTRVDADRRKVDDALRAAEHERIELVDKPLNDLRRDIHQLAEVLRGLARVVPSWPESGGAEAEAQHLATLGGVADSALSELRAESAARVDLIAQLQSQIATTLAAANASDVVALQRQIDDERVSALALRHTIERSRADLARAHSAKNALHDARPVVAAIDVLYNLLLDSRFPTFVVNRRQQQLLSTASLILKAMTNDRYGFHEDFEIVDIPLGQRRSARTLSGGETFLASLALALALSEITASAGATVDSLFLDEGFGALDDDALSAAMEELQRRAQTGRLIGIVTHVKSVADHVDTVMRVTASILGSTVTTLTDEALSDFADAEAAASFSSKASA
ncbi:MAG TPA: SMC family ATPase [Candidatus Baltobacteraceae bacterium]